MRTPSEDDAPRRLRDRLACGESEAFAEAYDRFGPALYRFALRMLGRREEAEDVVQELFVSLVRSREHLRGVENLASYLFVSLRRLIGRSHRQQRRTPRLHEGDLDQVAVRREETDAADVREQLHVALQMLPIEQREVVAMKIDGELTFADIAEVLQINPNTVASRYRYALEKLRDQLRNETPRT